MRMVWWHWLAIFGGVGVFFLLGHLSHPREWVSRVRDGKILSPKYSYLVGKEPVVRAATDQRPPWER